MTDEQQLARSTEYQLTLETTSERLHYTMCTAAKTYEIGQNRLKLAE